MGRNGVGEAEGDNRGNRSRHVTDWPMLRAGSMPRGMGAVPTDWFWCW